MLVTAAMIITYSTLISSLIILLTICFGEPQPTVVMISPGAKSETIGISSEKSRKARKKRKKRTRKKKKRKSNRRRKQKRRKSSPTDSRSDKDFIASTEHPSNGSEYNSMLSKRSPTQSSSTKNASKHRHERPGLWRTTLKTAVNKMTKTRKSIRKLKHKFPTTMSPFKKQLFYEEPQMGVPSEQKPPIAAIPLQQEKQRTIQQQVVDPHNPEYQTMANLPSGMLGNKDVAASKRTVQQQVVDPHNPEYQTMANLPSGMLGNKDVAASKSKHANTKAVDPFNPNYQTMANVHSNQVFSKGLGFGAKSTANTKQIDPHHPEYQTMAGVNSKVLFNRNQTNKIALTNKKTKQADPFDAAYQTMVGVNDLG